MSRINSFKSSLKWDADTKMALRNLGALPILSIASNPQGVGSWWRGVMAEMMGQ